MEPAAGGGQQARRGSALLALLSSSLLLNAVFLAHHLFRPSRVLSAGGDGGGGSSCGLSWSLQAAREAEAVAAVDCSGHGQVFLDGVAGQDGRPGCECNACFAGPDCSLRAPNCTADVNSLGAHSATKGGTEGNSVILDQRPAIEEAILEEAKKDFRSNGCMF